EVAQSALHVGALTSVLSVGLALAGVAAMWLAWRRSPATDPSGTWRLRPALEQAFFVDALYDRAFVRPVRAAAQAVRWTDDTAVLGAVDGTGSGARGLGRLVTLTQQGNVQTYLTGVLAGVLLLVLGVVTLT
ncbi:MAG TPA: hypothetical protein VFU93_10370, partial [Acidimicrobiales bacterium]|nr:hypothetical protein [Acidimicrobiales bacterium]